MAYSDKFFRKQVFKAWKHKRKDLLNNMTDKWNNNHKLLFNIIYHPSFSNLKDTLIFLHPLLNTRRRTPKVISCGFQRVKSLKDILVTAKVLPVKKKKGFCGPCKKSRCEICENVVHLFTCKTYCKQYAGTTEDFRQGSVIIDVPLETFWKEKKWNKSHLAPIPWS